MLRQWADEKFPKKCAMDKINIISLPPGGFGFLFNIENGEKTSGFCFNMKTDHGDCGRPIIVKNNSGYKILGLIKTYRANENDSIAIDSTAIKRTINELAAKGRS